ncbi:phospholipase A and acyltransferase 4-like [Artibeus jamaicensis]|uniref:phospholipase A and acyltransferase 4-like n=1 Tax=Artibeus jamaicensis TaxID=9417 RepID=UPI00235B0645|nr:phospholipase A and acyltransferase 4-like [Artibeus jamaicensis]
MASSLSSECSPGDLIEIFRPGFQHWALYVGDGYVVHLAPPGGYPGAGISSLGSVLGKTAEVKRELLTDVVGNCKYRVNNLLEEEMKPLPVREILSSAESMIGKKMEYGITSKNCEHFVTQLRYGEPRCLQVEKAVMGAGLAGALGAIATLAYSVMKN